MKKVIAIIIFILLSLSSTCFSFEPPGNNYILLDYKENFYYFYLNKPSMYAARIFDKNSTLYNDRLFVVMSKGYMPAFETYDMALWEIDIDKKLSRQTSRIIFDEKTGKELSVAQPEKFFSEIPEGTFMEELYFFGYDIYDDLVKMQIRNNSSNFRRNDK